MELLKRFCGEGEGRALKSVRYTSGLNYLPRFKWVARKASVISSSVVQSKMKSLDV